MPLGFTCKNPTSAILAIQCQHVLVSKWYARGMETQSFTEKELLTHLKAALAINADAEVMHLLTELACMYIDQGLTQEGADILAFVLCQPELAVDTHRRASDAYDDLASTICPRVLLDAQTFASKAHLTDIVDYVFAGADV